MLSFEGADSDKGVAMRMFAAALALTLALPVSTDMAFAQHGGGGFHGGGFHGGGFHGGWGGWHGGWGWGCCGYYGAYWGWAAYGPYWAYYDPYFYDPYYYGPAGYYGDDEDDAGYQGMAPGGSQAGPGQPQSWYYCDNPKGYYPYITACKSQWRMVPAQPAPTGAAPPAQ